MTLTEACEPLFQKICELNRTATSQGLSPDYHSLRRDLSGLMDTIRNTIASNPSLQRHWAKIEMPLLFFIDSMISESVLAVASQWNKNRLAYDFKELAGDQKFYDLLDENLKDSSEDATERLGVFYTCIGLGFTGFYSGRPDQLRSRMIEMISRIDPTVCADNDLHICPEAYENLDTRDLIEAQPIPNSVLVFFFIALCVVFFVVLVLLYQNATLEFRRMLALIISHALDQHIFRYHFFL
jgi:hypothetical protein